MVGSGGAAPANEAAPIQQAAPPPVAGGAAPGASASAAMPAPAAGGSATDRTSQEAAGLATAGPSGSSDVQVFTGGNPDEVAPDTTGAADSALRDDASGFSVLLVVGGALLIAGLGLFALRWSARRLS
jgi:hypothetical protein